jgi:hypothetical protein
MRFSIHRPHAGRVAELVSPPSSSAESVSPYEAVRFVCTASASILEEVPVPKLDIYSRFDSRPHLKCKQPGYL